MAKNRRITARCDDELYDKIRDEADAADMQIPEYLRHICQYFSALENNELPLKLKQVEKDNNSYQEQVESMKTQRDTFKGKFEKAGEAITKLESIIFECEDQGFFGRLFGVKPQGLQNFLQEKLKSQIQ